jgi:hypothetical protein
MSLNATEALQKVNAMKEEYGNGVSSLIRIYNASGEPLVLCSSPDWHGHIGKYPIDGIIQNGQWCVFLHVKTSGTATGSSGAVVYNASQAKQDVFFSWGMPFSGDNSVYCESREPNHWPPNGKIWDLMYKLTNNASSHTTDTWGNHRVSAACGQSSSPVVDFVIMYP